METAWGGIFSDPIGWYDVGYVLFGLQRLSAIVDYNMIGVVYGFREPAPKRLGLSKIFPTHRGQRADKVFPALVVNRRHGRGYERRPVQFAQLCGWAD